MRGTILPFCTQSSGHLYELAVMTDVSDFPSETQIFIRIIIDMNVKRKRRKIQTPPFSKILRSLMSEKKMTLRQASAIAGVSPSTIDDWRAGATPEDYMAVKKLAKSLGVSLSFILTGEDDTSGGSRSPSLTEVFDDGGSIFDGYAKITIQRLIPRKNEKGD